jgi:hypothetical protein
MKIASLDGIVVRMPGCVKVNPYQDLPALFLSNSDSVRDGHSFFLMSPKSLKAGVSIVSPDLSQE